VFNDHSSRARFVSSARRAAAGSGADPGPANLVPAGRCRMSGCSAVTVHRADGTSTVMPPYTPEQAANAKAGQLADTPRRRCEASNGRLPIGATVRRRWCASCNGSTVRQQANQRKEQP